MVPPAGRAYAVMRAARRPVQIGSKALQTVATSPIRQSSGLARIRSSNVSPRLLTLHD